MKGHEKLSPEKSDVGYKIQLDRFVDREGKFEYSVDKVIYLLKSFKVADNQIRGGSCPNLKETPSLVNPEAYFGGVGILFKSWNVGSNLI